MTKSATSFDRIESNGLCLELAPRRMSGALVAGWQSRRLAPLILQLPALVLLALLVVPMVTTVCLAAGARPLIVVCCAAVICAAWTGRRLQQNRWLPRVWDVTLWSLWLAGAVVAAIVAAAQQRWWTLAVWTVAAVVGAVLLWLWLRKSLSRWRSALLPGVVGVAGVGVVFASTDGRESYVITVAWVVLTALLLGLTIVIAWSQRETWWPWWPLIVPFGVSAFVAGLAGRLIVEWFADDVTTVRSQTFLYALMLGGAFAWVWFGALFVLVRAAIASIEADPVRSSDLAGLEGWPRWWRLLGLLNPVLVIVGLVVTVAAARVFDIILVGVPGPLQYTLDSVTLHWWYLPSDTAADRAAAAAFSLPLAVLVGLLAWLLQMGMPRHHTRWPTPPRAAVPVHLRMLFDGARHRGTEAPRTGPLSGAAVALASRIMRLLAAILDAAATVVQPDTAPAHGNTATDTVGHGSAGEVTVAPRGARGVRAGAVSATEDTSAGEEGGRSSVGRGSVTEVSTLESGARAASVQESGIGGRSAGERGGPNSAGAGSPVSGTGEVPVNVVPINAREGGRGSVGARSYSSGAGDAANATQAGAAAIGAARAGTAQARVGLDVGRGVANGGGTGGDWVVRVAIAGEMARYAECLERRGSSLGTRVDSVRARFRRRVLPVGRQAGVLCLRVGLVALVLVLPLVVLGVNTWRGLDGPALVGAGAVWRDGELWHALRNTASVAVVASLLTVSAALPPAYYAASPWPASGRAAVRARARSRAVMGLLVVLAVLPAQVYLGPIRSYITDHELAGTSMPLILVHAAIGLPIAILILRGALLSPADSPLTDTRDPASVGYRVRGVARTAGPAVGAVVVLQLVQVWNDFFIGLQVRGADASPWSLLLWSEARQVHEGVAHLAAAGLLSSVPPVVLLLLTWRRFLVPGLTGGVLR